MLKSQSASCQLLAGSLHLIRLFFAIIAVQFIRLKYTTSYYTRHVFNKIDKSASRLIPSLIYNYSFGYLKSWVEQTATKVDTETEKESKEAENKDEDDEPKV